MRHRKKSKWEKKQPTRNQNTTKVMKRETTMDCKKGWTPRYCRGEEKVIACFNTHFTFLF